MNNYHVYLSGMVVSGLLVLDYSCTRTFQALCRRITRDAGSLSDREHNRNATGEAIQID